MAINVETVKQKRYGIFDQAAWGTAALDTVNLTNAQVAPQGFQLDVDALSIVPNVNVRPGKQSVGTRRPFTESNIHDTKGVSPIFPLPAFEAKKDEIDFFIYAMMQACTEGVATPYIKTFTIADGQPDFSASAGMFITAFERFYTASKSRKIKDAIMKSLTLRLEPGGRLMVSGELMGRGAMVENANPSGTWARSDSNSADFFWFHNINRCTLDTGSGATPVRLTGPLEVTFSNDAEPFGSDGSGNTESVAIVNWNIGLKMQIQDDPTVNIRNPLEVAHRLGSVCTLELGWGTNPPAADGDLEITATFQITDVSPDSANVLGLELTGLIGTSAIGTSPITIIMANAIDRVW